MDIDGLDNPVGEFQNRAFHVRFFPNGTVKYWRDTHIDVPDIAFEPDTWIEVHIRADMANETFDLTVGEQVAKGLLFGCTGVRRVQCIAFCPNTGLCTMYVDWVKVDVEP